MWLYGFPLFRPIVTVYIVIPPLDMADLIGCATLVPWAFRLQTNVIKAVSPVSDIIYTKDFEYGPTRSWYLTVALNVENFSCSSLEFTLLRFRLNILPKFQCEWNMSLLLCISIPCILGSQWITRLGRMHRRAIHASSVRVRARALYAQPFEIFILRKHCDRLGARLFWTKFPTKIKVWLFSFYCPCLVKQQCRSFPGRWQGQTGRKWWTRTCNLHILNVPSYSSDYRCL